MHIFNIIKNVHTMHVLLLNIATKEIRDGSAREDLNAARV